MVSDIYYWRMSAKEHKDSIRALTREILDAYKNQDRFPISLISDLLPLQTEQTTDINSRGDFIFNNENFTNEADSELWVEFYDPVMEEFSTTIPKKWEGHITIINDVLTIVFDKPLELEIPHIISLGIDRSAYQMLESIQISSFSSISKLKDANNEDKETWIKAIIEDGQDEEIDFFELDLIKENTEVFGTRVMNNASLNLFKQGDTSCGGTDPNDPEWYVYNRGGLCITHHGTMYGSNGYSIRYGPSTKADCDNWINNSCNDVYMC